MHVSQNETPWSIEYIYEFHWSPHCDPDCVSSWIHVVWNGYGGCASSVGHMLSVSIYKVFIKKKQVHRVLWCKNRRFFAVIGYAKNKLAPPFRLILYIHTKSTPPQISIKYIVIFGIMGCLMNFIGPLTVIPTVSLVGFTLFGTATAGAHHQWDICCL